MRFEGTLNRELMIIWHLSDVKPSPLTTQPLDDMDEHIADGTEWIGLNLIRWPFFHTLFTGQKPSLPELVLAVSAFASRTFSLDFVFSLLSAQYFASTMMIVGLSVVVTVLVLQFHHHDPHGGKMPKWVGFKHVWCDIGWLKRKNSVWGYLKKQH